MGNNIKNLDALHRVMKGDMTHDGSFYKIGDITHRKDGDYRKVAEGKWVPVKGSSKAKSFRDNLQDVINSSPNLKGRNVDEIIKVLEAAGYDTNVTGGNISKRNTENGTPVKADGQGQMGAGENASEKPAEPKGGEPKAEGGKRQLKRRADGTIIYETPDDVIYDMVENYNELDRGDLQGVIEAAAMSHGWDENEILEEVDRQAAEKYNLGVDSAAPRLTRDTKIRLSRIKREQTQDKTYNVGETSQRKDGLYKKVAPGKWAPVKGGGSAGAPAGGNAEVNPITGKPLRPETVAYAKQKKAEAEQKRNTEKTAGGFTLAQNDKIKNAATDVIFKRRGEKLTPADLQREYKMSDEEANETVRRVNEYFENLQKDRKEFAKAGENKAQNAKQQASPIRKADFSSKNPAEIKRVYKPQTEAEAKEMNEISRFMKEETGADLGNALMARESYYKNTKNPTPEEQQGLAALMRIMGKVGFEKED